MNQTLLLAWVLLALGDPARAHEVLIAADATLSRGVAVQDVDSNQNRGRRAAIGFPAGASEESTARAKAAAPASIRRLITACERDASSSFGFLRLDPSALHPVSSGAELAEPRPSAELRPLSAASVPIQRFRVAQDSPRSPPTRLDS